MKVNRLEWVRLAASAGAATLLPTWGAQKMTGTSLPTPATQGIEIVNSAWEVRPGLVVPIRTYGGTVPGRLLRFQEGQRASIQVTNRSGESQTIHWHGVVVPETVDGTAELGTEPIASGAAKQYEFLVRPAGSRWYQSHMHEGLFSGMYGPTGHEFSHDGPGHAGDGANAIPALLGPL